MAPVTSQLDGRVATVTIDRPDQLNALSTDIEDALQSRFADLAERDPVAVVLRTTGDAFVAGADLKEIHGLSGREFRAYQRNARETNNAIASHPAMVIAAVDGLAYGGGFEKALAADLVVAGEGATFGLPEISLGLIPGGGATQRLPRIVGATRAKELLATGEPIDADEAARLGIANRVVADDRVDEAARELADEIAANAPLAVREAKRIVDEGLESSLSTGLSLEQEITVTLFDTDDAAEGIEAFVEKRDASFKGR